MDTVRLITVDPAHFHASLIQKEMYPNVSPRVQVYSPLGKDLLDHLQRVVRFNTRAEKPTSWELEIHAAPDFFERMLKDRPGNVVVFSGRNQVKMDRILRCIEAGLSVLADKPWILKSSDLPKLEQALDKAGKSGLAAYDIMTERFEVTSILHRELVNTPGVFGKIVPGTADEPAVAMLSVHNLMKMVAGAPLIRPAWFFDINQQGEGLSDVGVHVVDLAQWTLFPDTVLDYRKDVAMLRGERWPTVLTEEQFRRVTAEPGFPAFLNPWIKDGKLEYFCNNRVTYALRGVHIRLDVSWEYEAVPGAGDKYEATFRGTKSRVEVRQGQEENYRPEIYVIPNQAGDLPAVRAALEDKLKALAPRLPGLGVAESAGRLKVTIPAPLRVTHEEHFAQVTNLFFRFRKDPASMPAWEKPNMALNYFISTKGVEMGHGK